ncbi:MAG: hypothetical protein K8S56_07790 [Candidatus Cloacimonetes bacterium]|nr:hypothetical protein [Candidatus Cloacimonadota bacterium]
MKATLLVFAILVATVMLSAQLSVTPEMKFIFDNNTFELSDYDLEEFENGDPDFDFIVTTDDFIISPSLRMEYQFKLSKKLKLTPFISGKYDLYTQNSDRTKYSTSGGMKSDFGKLDISLMYGYYPGNYTRMYDVDPFGLQKYEYDKNMYKLSGDYKIFRKDWVYIDAKYEQYFYNEYWTHYDGDQLTFGVGWRHSFRTFYLKLFYRYSDYKCDDPLLDKYDSRDYTNQANHYNISFINKKVEVFRRKYIKPRLSFAIEEKHFQTDLQDKLHNGRTDKKYTLNVGCKFYFFKDIVIDFDYMHQYRKASSDYEPSGSDAFDFERYKNYLKNEFSLAVEYEF